MSWSDYWKKNCAPKLKKKKEELGRGVPEREIADYVEANSGKNTTRALVSLWLLGDREPYISQFYALCKKLELEPEFVLTPIEKSVGERTPLRRTSQNDNREAGIKHSARKLKKSR